MHKHSFHASSRSSSPVVARHRARSHRSRPSYRRRAGVHPCATYPRRRDDRAKDGVRERTHRERLHLFDDSVRLRRGEDDGAARGGSRTRGGGLRARGFARARRRSVSRSIRLSVVHRRARALKTRGGDEENIHRATSARPRRSRRASRRADVSTRRRARSGSRARRRPFAARVTLAANARGRSRARARERVVENGRTLETLLTNAGAACARTRWRRRRTSCRVCE